MSRKELKLRGKSLLNTKNYWLNVAVVFFMTLNINGIVSKFTADYSSLFELMNPANFSWGNFKAFILNSNTGEESMGSIIWSLAIILFELLVLCTLKTGGIRYFMKLRKNNPVNISEVFAHFRDEDKTFLNIAKVNLRTALSCFLWGFLFVIPGVIKVYEYWAVNYILAVRPDTAPEDAMELSKAIMKGHKLDLFVLDLSFIGWEILNTFTYGILGYLYLTPYKEATKLEFYSAIRLEAIASGIVSEGDVPDYMEIV